MKKLFFATLCSLVGLVSFSQDTLYLKNNTVVTGKIEQIKKSKIILEINGGMMEVDRMNVDRYVLWEDRMQDSLVKPVTTYWKKSSFGTQFFAPGGGMIYERQILETNFSFIGNLQVGQVKYYTPYHYREYTVYDRNQEKVHYYDRELRNLLGFKLGLKYNAFQNYNRFRPYIGAGFVLGYTRVYKSSRNYEYFATSIDTPPVDVYILGQYADDKTTTYSGAFLQLGIQQALTERLNLSFGIELMGYNFISPGQTTYISRKDGSEETIFYPDRKSVGYRIFWPLRLAYNF